MRELLQDRPDRRGERLIALWQAFDDDLAEVKLVAANRDDLVGVRPTTMGVGDGDTDLAFKLYNSIVARSARTLGLTLAGRNCVDR